MIKEPNTISALPIGWLQSSKSEALSRINELNKEMSTFHILYNRNISVIAHREDCDDILCQDNNNQNCLFIVHLSWTGKKETNSNYPKIVFDGNYNDFINYQTRYL
jgi:hypothetical protein